MSSKKILGIITVISFLVFVYYLAIGSAEKKVKIPNLAIGFDLENATSAIQSSERTIQYYLHEIEKNPAEVDPYIALAQHYLKIGRSTGQEIKYTSEAEKIIRSAIELDSDNALALAIKATLYVTKHRFEEAIPLAEEAIRINPYLAYAYGILVDANAELGNYDKAVEYCDKMISIRPDLRSYSRVSYLRELHGDPEGAIDAMKLAASAGMPGYENRAWSLFYLGDLFLDKGDLETAEAIFTGILQESPGYVHAMSGLAEIKMAQQNYEEAVSLLLHAYEIAPDHNVLELLTAVYTAAGKKVQADKIIKKVFEIFSNYEKNGWNINLEYARYGSVYNVNLKEALYRIERELIRRPGNIEVLEIYAWVLFKNGRAKEAMPIIMRALRLETKDAELYFRAGQISKAIDQMDKYQYFLAETIKINPEYLKNKI